VYVGKEEYGLHPSNHLERCDVMNDDEISFTQGQSSCHEMDKRFIEFAHAIYHEKRLALNYFQPQIVKSVTKEGFIHTTLPTATYLWLKEWYEKSQPLDEVVEASSGSCMNQAVSPSTVTHIPALEKTRLAKELQPLLENWYGGDLIMTSIYGVRKYTNGSILRMHVDTIDTHVVSCSKLYMSYSYLFLC
jgi:hypothetical protein